MTSVKELPQFVRDILAAAPRVGRREPVSLSLGKGVASLRSDGEILDTLRAVILGCGRVAPQDYRAKSTRSASKFFPFRRFRNGGSNTSSVRRIPPRNVRG